MLGLVLRAQYHPSIMTPSITYWRKYVCKVYVQLQILKNNNKNEIEKLESQNYIVMYMSDYRQGLPSTRATQKIPLSSQYIGTLATA
jgi:hypothetical protein